MADVVRFRFDEPGSRVLRQWNEERRMRQALAQRASQARRDFAGASISRLTMSLAQSSRSVNADLDSALTILRSRARNLCANYDYAKKFLSLVAMNIVGPMGPQLLVRAMADQERPDKAGNDAVERAWGRWTEACDVRMQLTFAHLLHVTIKAVARDGEALVRVVRNRALPCGVALQLLEIDRLDEALNQRLSNGNVIRMGVELDTALRPVAYWLLTQHPGENYNAIGQRKHERVVARDIYHLYVPERAEQVRGYTWLHAVLLRAANMQGFEEAAVVASRVGASKMGFFKRTGDPTSDDALKRMADATDPNTGALQMDAQPGEFIDLPPGYDFESFDPDYPHALYADFVRSCLRAFASGTDTDYASLSNDRSSENYSSIRHGKLEANDVWIVAQEWLHAMFLRPFFRTDWLPSAIIRGDITFPSGSAMSPLALEKFAEASEFRGRRWPWVDPLKDAQASKELISAGLTSRRRICASQGEDFEDIVRELGEEKTMLEAAGLPGVIDKVLAAPVADAPPTGAPAAAPAKPKK